MLVLLLVFLVGLISSETCHAQSEITVSPIYSVRQGEILVLRLDEETCFRGVQPLNIFEHVYRCDPDGRLIIGADLHQAVGTYVLDGTNIRVDVMPGNFPDPVYRRRGRRRTMSEKQRRAKEALRKEERVLISRAITSGPRQHPNFPAAVAFRMPLDEIVITDPFALKRLYYRRKDRSDAVPSWHTGDDYATRKYYTDKKTGKRKHWAVTGKPVYAVAPGVVMLAHHFTAGAEGKMIVLYHGSGIYSLYLHLNRFEVLMGQTVNKGQLIAKSGKTGASAPHLHFMIKVNTRNVNPSTFIERFNASLPKGDQNDPEKE